jgi:hypothetical protein
VSNMLFLQSRLSNGTPTTQLYQVGLWLDTHTKPGDVVFNANWSWFTMLYYYAPQDDYIAGLEPRFTYTYNAPDYWLWTHIAEDGYVCSQQNCPDKEAGWQKAFSRGGDAAGWAKTEGDAIADALQGTFNSKYVVSSRDYLTFNYIMDHNPRFKRELYSEQYGFYIYMLVPKTDAK